MYLKIHVLSTYTCMVEWKVIARLTDKILIKRKVYSPFVFLKSIFEIFLKFEYLSYLSFKITWNKTFTFIVGLFNHNHASATQLRKIPWSNQMKTGEKTPIKSERHNRDPLVNRNLSGRYNENNTTPLFKICLCSELLGSLLSKLAFYSNLSYSL